MTLDQKDAVFELCFLAALLFGISVGVLLTLARDKQSPKAPPEQSSRPRRRIRRDRAHTAKGPVKRWRWKR